MADDNCDSLINPARKNGRIYHYSNYGELDPQHNIALVRAYEKAQAKEILSRVFNPMLLIELQADQALVAVKILKSAYASETRPKLPNRPSPLLSGLHKAVEFVQDAIFISEFKNDALILFLSYVYELQDDVQTHMAITWMPERNGDQAETLKTEVTDQLTELKMHLWRLLRRRGLSNEDIKRHIHDFFDLEIVIPSTPRSQQRQEKRKAVFELLDMDIQIFYQEKILRQ